MGKINESEAKAVVVKYLTNQNRPYSVNDLFSNLRNEVPKTLLQKTLDVLVEESKIKEKVNGKQKVFLIFSPSFTNEKRAFSTCLWFWALRYFLGPH